VKQAAAYALLATLMMVRAAEAGTANAVRTIGVVSEATDTTIVVQPRAKPSDAAAAVTLAVNADTVYAAAAPGVVSDAAVGATVAVATDADGAAGHALALVVYQPAKESANTAAAAEAAVVVMARQARLDGAGKPAAIVVGKVTVVNGAKLTVESGGYKYIVTTTDNTAVKTLSDRTQADITQGVGVLGVSTDDGTTLTARCVLLGLTPARKVK
jgi:hypothetical protein